MRNLSLASFLALLTACSVPVVDFTGTGDGGTDATDAPVEVTLVVSTDNATVAEGGLATFTVQLSGPPAAAVPVTIDSGDDNRVGVTPSSVSFDGTNWNQPRTITLSGREDTDAEDETVTVTLSSSVGDDAVQVTVTDNDVLSLEVSPAGTLEVVENETAPFTVRPFSPAVVPLTSSSPFVVSRSRPVRAGTFT